LEKPTPGFRPALDPANDGEGETTIPSAIPSIFTRRLRFGNRSTGKEFDMAAKVIIYSLYAIGCDVQAVDWQKQPYCCQSLILAVVAKLFPQIWRSGIERGEL
jgi:hypothetical protein